MKTFSKLSLLFVFILLIGAGCSTNGLKVYKDKNFEFKYPAQTDGSDWKVEQSQPSTVVLSNPKINGSLSFQMIQNSDKVDTRKWLSKEFSKLEMKNIRDVTYTGQKAIAYTLLEFDGKVESKYVVFSNGDIFVNVYDNLITELPLTEQVLNTFAFKK